MNSKEGEPLVDVAFYLRGSFLDPNQVTSMLGIEATKARRKGEKWLTCTNKEVVSKIGFWELTSRAESMSISDQIGWIRQRLYSAACSPSDIPGVQEVEVSIFVALGSNAAGAIDYESTLSTEDLAWLSSIGAMVSFSFGYSPP